jgi:hypothetical protein
MPAAGEHDERKKSVTFDPPASNGHGEPSSSSHQNGDTPSGHAADGHGHDHHGHHYNSSPFWHRIMVVVHVASTYSLPLLSGIVGALVWINTDEDSYKKYLGHGHDTHVLFHDVRGAAAARNAASVASVATARPSRASPALRRPRAIASRRAP